MPPTITETTKAAPASANDRAIQIAQYTTNYDNQLASQHLIIADHSGANQGQALLVHTDGSTEYVGTPEGLLLTTGGVTSPCGCPIDGTKSLFVYPWQQGSANPLQRAYTFNWTTHAWVRITDPPVGGFLDDCCIVSIGGGKAYLFVTPDLTGSVRTFLFDMAGNGGLGSWTEKTGHASANPDTATLLKDGTILTVQAAVSSTCYIYDPAASAGAGGWTLVNGPSFNPSKTTPIVLHSGKVVVGGQVAHSISLYNPADQTWDNRGGFYGTAQLFVEYAPDQLIVFSDDPTSAPANAAQLYDIGTSGVSDYTDVFGPDHGGWLGQNTFFGVNTNGFNAAWRGLHVYSTPAGFVRRPEQTMFPTHVAWQRKKAGNGSDR
jgi:hypothetical protein